MLDKNNYYGRSVISELNNLIQVSSLPVIKLFGNAPYFPDHLPQKRLKIWKSSNLQTLNVVSLPITIKERTVQANKQIRVDEAVAELELFDHMIVDGDIVSINFNGDWILEKELELEKGQKK